MGEQGDLAIAPRLGYPGVPVLRHHLWGDSIDDPASLALVIKVMLITVILLAVAYVVLRWFARRAGVEAAKSSQAELQCSVALRLSAKTKVYLLTAGTTQVLVTESTNGATLTTLSSEVDATNWGAHP
ncbi:hypothetical protein ACFW0H_01130 [Pseudomonas sp. CR3202]|uniref:hypothetical protein n=1 Tax=Pseudomonas sp. CR3202 TaxID=3351532 RepID=UPI003BF305BE